MIDQHKISIIMPAYNVQDFIGDCLGSIVVQSWSYWELIVVDDHSTDTTWSIIQQFAKKVPNIRPVKNVGKGIIAALQTGTKLATGSMISRMDADDLMPPDKLKQLATRLIEAGSGHVATGAVQYFSESQLGDGYQRYEKWLNDNLEAANPYQEIFKECVLPSPNWLLFKSDFDRINGFEGLVYPEDYDFCFRCHEHGLKIAFTNQVTHHWRDHANRTSRTSDHYADNGFFTLKVTRFKSEFYDPSHDLILWGAGKKGKTIAQLLDQVQLPFRWICDNPNKIGHNIYGHMLLAETATNLENTQIIVAVSSPDQQQQLREQLSRVNALIFFFC